MESCTTSTYQIGRQKTAGCLQSSDSQSVAHAECVEELSLQIRKGIYRPDVRKLAEDILREEPWIVRPEVAAGSEKSREAL